MAIFAVDFDGTVVTHEYPEIGKDVGAVKVLKDLVEAKHRIILFTMRSGDELDAAVRWFSDNDIPLFGINKNPEQHTWTKSAKPYAHAYIDDAALGVPLLHVEGKRAYVDWVRVEELLHDRGYL